jgi:hypothetical protein
MDVKNQSPAFKGAFCVRIPYIGDSTRRIKALTKLTYKIFDDAGARVVLSQVKAGDSRHTTTRVPAASVIKAVVPDDNDVQALERFKKTVANAKKLKKEFATVHYRSDVGDNFPDNEKAGEVLSLLW